MYTWAVLAVGLDQFERGVHGTGLAGELFQGLCSEGPRAKEARQRAADRGGLTRCGQSTCTGAKRDDEKIGIGAADAVARARLVKLGSGPVTGRLACLLAGIEPNPLSSPLDSLRLQ